ncbi:SMP-30/gluconolactonase/LRE family protein [Fodinibius sp.]|uniref:SMP-30/gluconolactonase/LRE family protein n=1 Tax=Fodinibius sp. TaxID=1872440 RepID=UPI002ACDA28A|nr:SMP-30/gluconolactonase/LRE family protein [Fodinibius sp.]MDZ7658738.1 SMP-30/gluconolactonase/LRE family protein [Fodinibius sp.]
MGKISKALLASLLMIVLPVMITFGQQIVDEDAEPEKITDGYEFTEGPLWHDSGYLLFSDIPANTVYKWAPGEGAVIYLKPSGHSNGLAFDQEGNLLLAQHDGLVSRLSEDKKLTVVADHYNGKRLNSPNDLTIKSDGSIYFTDPPFGVSDEEKELDFSGVYRYSEENGLQLLIDDFDLPNGIVFSPDESRLYVNDTRHNHIRVFDVNEDGSLGSGRIFAEMESDAEGAADGMKVDTEGNIYSTGPGGLWIFSPEGKLLQQVKTPARITNLAWGGSEGTTLFLTAPNAVYKLETSKTGM